MVLVEQNVMLEYWRITESKRLRRTAQKGILFVTVPRTKVWFFYKVHSCHLKSWDQNKILVRSKRDMSISHSNKGRYFQKICCYNFIYLNHIPLKYIVLEQFCKLYISVFSFSKYFKSSNRYIYIYIYILPLY
jgi:hypothetical protein